MKKKKPDIPFEIIMDDTEDAINQIINTSGLPACLIVNMLASLYAQYTLIAKDIVNQKRNEYNQQLQEWENNR